MRAASARPIFSKMLIGGMLPRNFKIRNNWDGSLHNAFEGDTEDRLAYTRMLPTIIYYMDQYRGLLSKAFKKLKCDSEEATHPGSNERLWKTKVWRNRETYCSKKAKALNYRAKMNYHPCQPVPEGRVRLRHQKKCNQHRLCYKLQTHKLPVFLHSFKKTVPSATLAFVWPPGQSLRLS